MQNNTYTERRSKQLQLLQNLNRSRHYGIQVVIWLSKPIKSLFDETVIFEYYLTINIGNSRQACYGPPNKNTKE